MNSIIIARLLGPLLLAGAAAVLLNRKGVQKVIADASKNTAVIYLTGVMSLLFGLAIIQFHNVWVAGWPVLITVMGWMSLVRGIARIVFPEQMAELGERVGRREEWLVGSAVASAVLGAILTVKGLGLTP